MTPKIDDWKTFKDQVRVICDLITNSCKGLETSNLNLVSIDEKPGIQALERKEMPMMPGKPLRRDVEYKRNGKTCLIAGFEVNSGKIVHHSHVSKNDEDAFLAFIKQTIQKYDLHTRIVFLVDNLRTHSTVSLVKYIASVLGYSEPLGQNRKSGILKNLQTRREFLSDPSHDVYFQFTPKHCSWLNPIENWFSVLQRRVITNGNFASPDDLRVKIDAYIDFHNRYELKILNWQFTGFTKSRSMAA